MNATLNHKFNSPPGAVLQQLLVNLNHTNGTLMAEPQLHLVIRPPKAENSKKRGLGER